jgi:hypothetical protein
MTTKVRNSPSGPLEEISSGEQTAYSLIPHVTNVVAGTGVVPGAAVITFPEWNPGDVLDGELFAAIGDSPSSTVNVSAALFPEVSVDGGSTWHRVGVGSDIVAAGYQIKSAVAGDPSGSSVSCGWAVALNAAPKVRVSYLATSDFSLGGAGLNGFLSLLRCRRIEASNVIGSAPNTLL